MMRPTVPRRPFNFAVAPEALLAHRSRRPEHLARDGLGQIPLVDPVSEIDVEGERAAVAVAKGKRRAAYRRAPDLGGIERCRAERWTVGQIQRSRVRLR